eukprot:TRINITY_DN10380_c0_g2_i1.p1 TRINITY_DN10380_c0_g2~~TRINITY_DN10380_c0_g2_i1.p1  ORF type:complete len:537 (+),score=49.96 TRINITY_DN10380_c0_g2_i1:187-1797(+)
MRCTNEPEVELPGQASEDDLHTGSSKDASPSAISNTTQEEPEPLPEPEAELSEASPVNSHIRSQGTSKAYHEDFTLHQAQASKAQQHILREGGHRQAPSFWFGTTVALLLALAVSIFRGHPGTEDAGNIDVAGPVSKAVRDDAQTVAARLEEPTTPIFTLPLTRQQIPLSTVAGRLHYKSAYWATVHVGTPPAAFKVVFDTGSGHLILPSTFCKSPVCKAHKRYKRSASSTARDINEDGSLVKQGEARDQVTVYFGTGEVVGIFVEDQVCIPRPGKTRGKLTPAGKASVASESCMKTRFVSAIDMSDDPFESFDFDGVLGLGLAPLSQNEDFNALSVASRSLLEGSHMFSVYLSTDASQQSELTLGGWREDRLQEAGGANAAWTWNKVFEPALGHWMISVKAVRVDGVDVSFCSEGCRAIVDTGSSLLAVPSTAFGELHDLLQFEAEGGHCEGAGPTLELELERGSIRLDPKDLSRLEADAIDSQMPLSDTSPGPAKCKPMLMTVDLQAPIGPEIVILGEPFLRRYLPFCPHPYDI